MTGSTPKLPATRWVTAAVLQVLADMVMREGDWFQSSQLATWTAGMLTPEQRVHATTRLCALAFVTHEVVFVDGNRVDQYTVTADGSAAIQAAAQGHVRKSGPKGTRTPNPVRAGALTTRLWALVRLRKIIDSDEAARTLCDAGDQDFERVRATVRKTLRRWELAEALQAGVRMVKRRADPPSSNGNKRYVLVRDSVEPPRWRQIVKAGKPTTGGRAMKPPVNRMAYMDEPWFAILQAACEREDQRKVAARLGYSDGVISQALRGTGAYGSGAASPARLADKVLHKFGSYECPHLTEIYSEPRVITAAECRGYAHRATAPTSSPGLMDHWRACATCPHKPLSAPPVPKVPKPRKAQPQAQAQAQPQAAEPPASTTPTAEETRP